MRKWTNMKSFLTFRFSPGLQVCSNVIWRKLFCSCYWLQLRLLVCLQQLQGDSWHSHWVSSPYDLTIFPTRRVLYQYTLPSLWYFHWNFRRYFRLPSLSRHKKTIFVDVRMFGFVEHIFLRRECRPRRDDVFWLNSSLVEISRHWLNRQFSSYFTLSRAFCLGALQHRM